MTLLDLSLYRVTTLPGNLEFDSLGKKKNWKKNCDHQIFFFIKMHI